MYLALMPEEKEYDYAVLVLGATGVGKSSLCNFFFNHDVFETVPGLLRGTSSCNAHCCVINGKRIMFIDSPGFADTTVSNKERMQEMSKALLLARNGVHAIIVCLNGEGRFSDSDLGLINEMKKLEIHEPQSIWDYSFLLFTHGRSMGKTEVQRNEMIQSWKEDSRCPPLFHELLSKVQSRYMIVESLMEEKEYYKTKCNELFQLLEVIYSGNNNVCYSHRLFAWARDKYEEVARRQIQQETTQQEEIIKRLELLQRNDNLITQLENDKASLATKVEEIENELHKAELQLKENEHVINKKEAEINTMQKNQTLKIQDALHNLQRSRQEKNELEEMIENMQKQCTEQNRIIKEKQSDIEKEKQSKQQINAQLQEEKQAMDQLKENAKKFLQEKQIMGNHDTLTEALHLMTQEIDKKQEQLTEKGSEIDSLTQAVTDKDAQLAEKDNQLMQKEVQVNELTETIGSFAIFGIPIPYTNRKIIITGLAPRRK